MHNNIFVSFWKICLDNLPEGSFTHRHISAPDAKLHIDDARRRNALLGLSDDDLLAPYRKKQLDNHRALCRLLQECFGIELSIKDFFCKSGDDVNPLHSVNPLGLMTISESNALLVIACSYSLPESTTSGKLAFEIDPETVEFHLFTSTTASTEADPVDTDLEDKLTGSMRDYADEMDEIVAEAMWRREISGWLPNKADSLALETISEATGQPLYTLLDEALRRFLQLRNDQTHEGT